MQPPFTVEPAKPEDAEGIFDVQRLTWLDTYPNPEIGITEKDIRLRVEGEHGKLIPKKIERWRKAIEANDGKSAAFVVKVANKVIGFVFPAIIGEQRRIGAIYVLPSVQSQGIGKLLLEQAIKWHGSDEDIFLHVASYNKNAINFYKRNGFEETGEKITDETALANNSKAIPEIEMVRRANS